MLIGDETDALDGTLIEQLEEVEAPPELILCVVTGLEHRDCLIELLCSLRGFAAAKIDDAFGARSEIKRSIA